jgi:hypothetical protein
MSTRAGKDEGKNYKEKITKERDGKLGRRKKERDIGGRKQKEGKHG